MNYTTLIAAAALATLPMMASAAPILITDGDTTPIAAGGENEDGYFFDTLVSEGVGEFNHTFTLETAGSGTAGVSLLPLNILPFNSLVASWLNAVTGDVIATTTVGAGATFLATKFEDPNSLSQTLNLTWDVKKGTPDFTFDGTVEISTVPVPAGLLLMGTALAGLGLTRRKA